MNLSQRLVRSHNDVINNNQRESTLTTAATHCSLYILRVRRTEVCTHQSVVNQRLEKVKGTP